MTTSPPPSEARPAKPKIFVFINSINTMGYVGTALAESGDFIAGHCSSSEHWFRHDMGLTGDWQHDKYAAHYPDGYELVEVPVAQLKGHAGIDAAYALHLAKNATENVAK